MKKGFRRSEVTKEKIRVAKLGDKNPMWRGDKVSLTPLHVWVRARKTKPKACPNCGQVTSKIDLANISGKYRRDVEDFEWLCRRCHMLSDGRMKNLVQFQKETNGLPHKLDRD